MDRCRNANKATVKLWDLRAAAPTLTFRAAEGVRDVAWLKNNENTQFVCALENGIIQKWDMRNTRVFETSWGAHSGVCLCLDVRQDGMLVSGGRDKSIKVSLVAKFNYTIVLMIEILESNQ